MTFSKDEVLEAFHTAWTIGSTNEDWEGWVERLTPDVEYVERQFGTMHGRDAVRAWITDLMAVRFDVHAVLNWYIVAGDRVVFDMSNRYYHPDPSHPHLDFAGLTVLTYGGDGLFKREEDYWDATGAKTCYLEWSAACKAWGRQGPGERPWRAAREAADRRQPRDPPVRPHHLTVYRSGDGQPISEAGCPCPGGAGCR